MVWPTLGLRTAKEQNRTMLPRSTQTLPKRHHRHSVYHAQLRRSPLFALLTVDDIVNAVRQLPNKFSAADPLQTSTLKQAVDLLAPFIVEVFNRSLARGYFPAGFKKAFITPTAKKPSMDTTDVSSYRPISNLPVLS